MFYHSLIIISIYLERQLIKIGHFDRFFHAPLSFNYPWQDLFICECYLFINIIMLTHSKTILENTAEIEPQPVALDFKNLSQYSSRSK